MSERTLAEQRLRMDARVKVNRIQRAAAEIERLQSEVAQLTAELDAQVDRESDRLGVPVPADAFLLDMLERVEVGPNSAWFWLGGTNNKGLPVVRTRDGGRNGAERSVPRLLAEAFGLIDPDWEGILYPLNGADDVNPWHREMRVYPEGKYRGNPRRYTWRDSA